MAGGTRAQDYNPDDPLNEDPTQNGPANPTGPGTAPQALGDPSAPVSAPAQPGGTSRAAAPSAPAPPSDGAGIAAAYQQYLGRAASPDEINLWTGHPNYAAEIAGSQEAQNRSAASGNPMDANYISAQVRNILSRYGVAPSGPGSGNGDVAYWVQRALQTGGWQGGNADYWTKRIDQEINRPWESAQAEAANRGPGVLTRGGPLTPTSGGPSLITNGGPLTPNDGPSMITNGGPLTPNSSSAFTDQVRQLLMQRLQAVSNPVDPNAPEITQPMDAATLQNQRQQEDARKTLAERLYAEGSGNGGVDQGQLTQGVMQNQEKGGEALTNLRATLVQQAFAQRKSELQNLLGMALQSGDAESARAIQMQLADLEAQLRREGYGVDLARIKAQQDYNAGAGLIG